MSMAQLKQTAQTTCFYYEVGNKFRPAWGSQIFYVGPWLYLPWGFYLQASKDTQEELLQVQGLTIAQ